jgi:hypothetical protein
MKALMTSSTLRLTAGHSATHLLDLGIFCIADGLERGHVVLLLVAKRTKVWLFAIQSQLAEFDMRAAGNGTRWGQCNGFQKLVNLGAGDSIVKTDAFDPDGP